MLNTVHTGSCLDLLPAIPDSSIDAVITDPPYPGIERDYGYWSEEEWHTLMDGVVLECKRVLKPKGSAVFVLQPNYNTLGSMRLWLWEFMVRTAKSWNLVQNMYWWKYDALPLAGCNRDVGLMRNSVKYCLWFGAADCCRYQDQVLWTPGKFSPKRLEDRALKYMPSGASMRDGKCFETSIERGGSVPFNLLPLANNSDSGLYGHGAGTPVRLAEWWTRYLTRPGDTVLDPFCGAGSIGVACVGLGRSYVGIEALEEYASIARQRLA